MQRREDGEDRSKKTKLLTEAFYFQQFNGLLTHESIIFSMDHDLVRLFPLESQEIFCMVCFQMSKNYFVISLYITISGARASICFKIMAFLFI